LADEVASRRPLFRAHWRSLTKSDSYTLGTEKIVNAGIEREIGRVLSVSGSEARIGVFARMLRSTSSTDTAALTVGKFVALRRNRLLLVGIISQVSMEVPLLVREDGYNAIASVDLMGEIISVDDDPRRTHFSRGVTSYPAIGDSAFVMGVPELQMIYEVNRSAAIELGRLQQDTTVTARANIDDLISKHFAILGSTGVGKSSGR